MPDTLGDQQSVDLTTKWGALKFTGKDSVVVLLFILILTLGGLIFWSRQQQNMEHGQVLCAIKLNLFLNTIPKGQPIEWERMPVDLFPCIPKFLYSSRRE